MQVYLLHCNVGFGKDAEHYIGCTSRTAEKRFEEHTGIRKFPGAKVPMSWFDRGFKPKLAYVWDGASWDWESWLHKWVKHHRENRPVNWCPECRRNLMLIPQPHLMEH